MSASPRNDIGRGGDRIQRFPRTARLLTAADYARVFAEPHRIGDGHFTLLCRENGSTGARLGLAVSRKCSRKAVVRNRIKRLARESFRQEWAKLPPVDVVVMCRPTAAALDGKALRQAFDKLWQRLQKQWQSS